MEVRIDGRLSPGITAKDVILAIITRIGVAGGTGHVIEYTGSAIRALDMEGRMTICNMSIEAGARAGLISPDDTTFSYLHGRRHVPTGREWDAAVERWRALRTDDGATYDQSVTLHANDIEPMISYGTNPGMCIPIHGRVPDPRESQDEHERGALEKALRYMALEPGQPILGKKVDVVFLGSCTNSRLSDLRAAASRARTTRCSSSRRAGRGVRKCRDPLFRARRPGRAAGAWWAWKCPGRPAAADWGSGWDSGSGWGSGWRPASRSSGPPVDDYHHSLVMTAGDGTPLRRPIGGDVGRWTDRPPR
jgi:hypothetical protein